MWLEVAGCIQQTHVIGLYSVSQLSCEEAGKGSPLLSWFCLACLSASLLLESAGELHLGSVSVLWTINRETQNCVNKLWVMTVVFTEYSHCVNTFLVIKKDGLCSVVKTQLFKNKHQFSFSIETRNIFSNLCVAPEPTHWSSLTDWCSVGFYASFLQFYNFQNQNLSVALLQKVWVVSEDSNKQWEKVLVNSM